MKPLASSRLRYVIALLVCFPIMESAAQAQQEQINQVLLQKLQKANSTISACHVVWNRVQRLAPNPAADPEKWSAQALASAQQQGRTQIQALQEAQGEKEAAVRTQQGFAITSTLDFVRIGNSVLCTSDYLDPIYKDRHIEFSNGTEFLFASLKVKGQDVPKDATLSRDSGEALKMSAYGYQLARTLLGVPLDQNLTPSNPVLASEEFSLRQDPNGDVVAEREARIVAGHSQKPDAITFSTENLHPTRVETYSIAAEFDGQKLTMTRDKLETTVIVSGYKQYENGIWFPSKVMVKTPTMTTDYTLVDAKFNSQVDPADLLLPIGLRVADARFGYGSKLAIYKVSDGKLPTDEQVKAMIASDAQAKQAKAGDAKQTSVSDRAPMASIGGLGFIALGSLMLVRSRRKQS